MTKDDLKGDLKGFPMGVVVRMLEEQKLQRNKSCVEIFKMEPYADASKGGFEWVDTKDGIDFWTRVIIEHNFDLFFERYPDYERYNLS